MNNPRIGKGDNPPTQTVSGGKINIASDRVHLGHGYYARLDMPHHKDTVAFIDSLKAEVAQAHPMIRKPKVKIADDTEQE